VRPASVDPWSIAIAAASGAVLGVVVATAYHVLHDHSQLPFADVLPHFLPQLIAGCIGGALLLVWAAVAHDRQSRSKDRTRSPGSQSERQG